LRMDELKNRGWEKIRWVREHMPVLALLEERYARDKPLSGKRVAMAIHLEAKTARLALALKALGAEVAVTSSNPLSAKDDVALALSEEMPVHARGEATEEEYREFLLKVLSICPHLVLDDGGDLSSLLHTEAWDLGRETIGVCEETTTGVIRLRKLEREGKLRFPAIAVNDAQMKSLFDNRYGTGQSVWDAIMRTTNLLLAGKTVLVVGFGWCGKGIAQRARGLGAQVIVAEVDPVKAAEAVMEGLRVAKVAEAIKEADFVVTATGCLNAVTYENILAAKDGAILANAGHFDVEIDVRSLYAKAKVKRVREHMEECLLPNGKRVYLLAKGRLVNLVAGDGHPAEIMDLSFSLQFLSLLWLAREGRNHAPRVYPVPKEVDTEVARLFLRSRGIAIDELAAEQREYLGLA
jgi:adenosylhomocysteinase